MLLVAGLVAVGLMSWTRTRSIRSGTIPLEAGLPKAGSFRSSRTTLVAALAGVSAIAWGAAAAVRSGIEALLLVAGGTFIAVAGSVARVTGVHAGDEGLLVHFAARAPFHARWAEIHTLRPPGTPVGGWRLAAAGGTGTTLMPSDLFGHEELLAEIVARSGLSFDGRRWVGGEEREAIQG
jgi:hypothetical protein